jgi:N-acylneuraminate cytidylyltransferase/CMP-N,N'-diacetyllegionaminic acid synthase
MSEMCQKKKMMDMNILAIIPARLGSKRVHKKNIKPLNNKPLIGYTIEAAIRSEHISRIIVSTDSNEIAEVAEEFGAEIPFMRPKEISKSNSTEMEFFLHALNWMKNNENYKPDLIVLLYPTSPFRKATTIDKAVEKMIAHPDADSLRSIKKCSEHPYKMWKKDRDYLVPFVDSQNKNIHTFSYQMLPEVFIQNASIYITKPDTIFIKKSPTGNIIVPFIMDEFESIDINNEIDFKFAEFILNTYFLLDQKKTDLKLF